MFKKLFGFGKKKKEEIGKCQRKQKTSEKRKKK